MPNQKENKKHYSFKFEVLDRKLTLEEARMYHINYLENGPYVETEIGGVKQKVHSLLINRENLEILYDRGVNGIRLYFCKDDASKDYLNIIAVPLLQNGDPDVRTQLPNNGGLPLINTLEPCPNICPPAWSENDLNCRKKGGEFYWLKPNEKTAGGKTWFKTGGIAADKPTAPYEE